MKLTLRIRPARICCDDCGEILVPQPCDNRSYHYRCVACEAEFIKWMNEPDSVDESEGSTQ